MKFLTRRFAKAPEGTGAIQDELGIATRFMGTGEKLDDFASFDQKTYLENLL